jgi:CBS domain-containing protein
MQCGELVFALEMMKTHLQKTTPEATLSAALDLMDLYQTSSLPVVNEAGELMGILTESDVMHALFRVNSQVEAESFSQWREVGQLRVKEAMTHPVIVVGEREPVSQAALLLLRHRLKRIPVLSAEGRILGMLNRVDILQAIFEGSV